MIQVFKNTIRQYSIKCSWFLVLYIVLAAVSAISYVISIRATGNMTQAANLGVTDDMMSFLLVLAVAGLVQTVLKAIMDFAGKRAYGSVIFKIRKTFADRLLHMPYKDFSGKNSGEGASLFTIDVPQTASFLTIQILSQIAQVTTLLVSIIFMVLINWWLTLGYFLFFPVLALLQAKIAAPIGAKSEVASKRRADYNAVVSDSLQNPLTVLAYGLEHSVEQRFNDSFAEFYKAKYSASKTAAGLALVGIFATFLPLFAFFFVSCIVVINGGMSVAEFIALTIIAGPAATWLSMFSQELAGLQTAKASVVRVSGFVPEAEAGDGGQLSVVSGQLSGDGGSEARGQGLEASADGVAVCFRDVTFGYGDFISESTVDEGSESAGDGGSEGDGNAAHNVKVFSNTSFSIDKGGITAIAGPSGCGKSTALKLMLGLYAPDSGDVALFSPNVTYVPQDCYLLPVSIRDNIIAGLLLDEEKLRRACEKAGIYDFVLELPDGFDSVLVESAANVSGGQKQRLAMARAFYRDADILLLDEATSALDPTTEQAVLEAFKRYITDNGKTAVVVAHRQAVLDISDKIINLQAGLTFGEEVTV